MKQDSPYPSLIAGILISILIISTFVLIIGPYIPKAKAQPALTTIPFASGDVAPNIAYDSSTNRAWATYYGGQGLFRWDRSNGTTKIFTIPPSMEEGTIQPSGLALDSSGNIWLCTTRAIYKFIPQDGVFTKIVQASTGGCRMIYDGTYIWSSYNDGVKRITSSTSSVTDVQVSNNCFCHSLTPFNSGLLVIDRGHNRLYEVSSSLVVLQRMSGLTNPYGIQCSGSTCYMGEFEVIIPPRNNNTWTGGYVKQISTSTWTYIVRNLTSISHPTDVVIYSGFAGVLDQGTKTVRVYSLATWSLVTNIPLSFTPLYGHVDSSGNVYVGYYGSSGFIVISNPFVSEPEPEPEPAPQPPGQPPAQRPGEGDQREPININLFGDYIAKRGQDLNITASFSKNVTGHVYLYGGEDYIGREFLGYASIKGASIVISIKPDWVGSKNVFAKYSGDPNYKGNVSAYIKLESVIPRKGIGTIESSISISASIISVQIRNMDKHYIQNATVLSQVKNDRGEVVYLAWVRDLQIKADGSGTLGFGFANEVPRGVVEVFVWKSLEESIPLAEKVVIRN